MGFYDVCLKVMRHELGHWLMSRHVGFRAGAIEITIYRDDQKGGKHQYRQEGSSMVFTAPVVKNVDDLKEYLENRFQVLYAGIAAQIHGQKMSPEESGRIMEMDAANDLRIIRELAPMLRGMLYGPEQTSEITEEQIYELTVPIWERTLSQIEELYPKIDGMAKILVPFIQKHGAKYPFSVSLIEDAERRYDAAHLGS